MVYPRPDIIVAQTRWRTEGREVLTGGRQDWDGVSATGAEVMSKNFMDRDVDYADSPDTGCCVHRMHHLHRLLPVQG